MSVEQHLQPPPQRFREWSGQKFTEAQIAGASITEAHRAILRASMSAASYIDMGAALGLPIGTVKSRLNRARIALAKKLPRTDPCTHCGAAPADAKARCTVFGAEQFPCDGESP